MTASKRRGAFWPLVGCLALLATVWVPTPTSAQEDQSNDVEIQVLSNRADLISGGDALVEIVLPESARADEVRVRDHGQDINSPGRDISDAFERRPDGRLLGLVEGLQVGRNVLTAKLPDGRGARLTVTNHPIGGPVFSGPQVQPWPCMTEEYGLGPPEDSQCNTPEVIEFYYWSPTEREFKPYDPENPPDDLAQTTTDEGKTVPYIVRRERGVMNRGVYDVVVLHNPDEPWTRWSPQQQPWNGKLFVRFLGGCTPGYGQQEYVDFTSDQTGPPGHNPEEEALSRGYAVIASGLHWLNMSCNDVVSAETLMMLKEHVIETYGDVRYTISQGGSGGSMQQHWIVSNYPGLLDGIFPWGSYPDIWATMHDAVDCHLMNRVFEQQSPALWSNPQQQADAAGHANSLVCKNWDEQLYFHRLWFEPTFDPSFPRDHCAKGEDPNQNGFGGPHEDASWVYDPASNPEGARCTLQDYAVSVWGRRPPERWGPVEQQIERGFANRPLDNVGVQYGLDALQSGDILPEQFVDLNEKIGGFDIDRNWQAERSVADPRALEIAYRAGKVVDFREAAKVPIMDLRGSSNSEIHTDVYSYVSRQRLDQANGHHENQIIWTHGVPTGNGTIFTIFPTPVLDQALDVMDQWVSGIKDDGRDIPLEEKVLANRPADATDACFIGTSKITDESACAAAFPHYATPRIAAGGPLANNVLKCQLRPLDRDDDYGAVPLTDAQWERLEATFPDGVCDYTKPGVSQQPSMPWMTFANGPGGEPLGPPPTSVPIDAGQPSKPGRPECDTDRPGNQPPHCENGEHPGRGSGSVRSASAGGPLPTTGGGFAIAGLAAALVASKSLRRRDRRLDHTQDEMHRVASPGGTDSHWIRWNRRR